MKKRMIPMLFVLALLFSVFQSQKAVAAPAKMQLKDFYYYLSTGDEWSFMEVEDENGRIAQLHKGEKTYRGVKIGDKASKVTKLYGKQTKKKFDYKDSFHKFVKYYGDNYYLDTTNWAYYYDYTYKKGNNNSRTLRFYLNKKNKVVDVVYIHRIKRFKINDKNVDIDFKFRAPKGKQITTKNISGKKVQILPKGTTIGYNSKKLEKDFLGYPTGIMLLPFQINNKGQVIAIPEIPITIGKVKAETTVGDLLEREMDKVNAKTGAYEGNLDPDKLGKYRYFELILQDSNEEDGYDKPVTVYFKY